MDARRIYFRKLNGLDNFVWIFITAISLFSLVLLTSFLIGRKKCIPFTFVITPRSDSGYYTEKTLSLSLSVSAKHVSWDFGDGTPVKTGVYVTHQYHKEGKYYVSASISEGCEQGMEIVVAKNPYDQTSGTEIAGPDNIAVDKDATFNCQVYANTWSWEVIDHPELKVRNEKLGSAQFRFTSGGTYYIRVTLDNDRTKSFRKEVIVTTDGKIKPVQQLPDPQMEIKRLVKEDNPAPVVNPEPVVQSNVVSIKFISEKSFKDQLNQVIKDDNASPALEDFDQFLINKGQTTVRLNGATSMNFKKFYEYLKASGNITITSVLLQRDPANKLKVDFIVVTIDK